VDFIRKYFDLAQAVLVDFLLSWLFTLWMTLRHPIRGPQFLARKQAVGDRRAMPPLLFFFTSSLAYVIAFGIATDDRTLLAQGLLDGGTDAQVNIYLSTALFLLALITLGFWVVRVVRRWRRAGKPADRRRRRLPPEEPLITARYRALPYTAAFALIGINAGIALFLATPVFYRMIETGAMSLFSLLADTNFMAAGPWGGIFIAVLVAFPLVVLGFFVFMAPPFWPVTRLLFSPTALTRPPGGVGWRLRMAGWTVVTSAVFFGMLSATLWATNTLESLRKGRGIMLSGATCDLRAWPEVSAAVMVRNEQRFPGLVSGDAFLLTLDTWRFDGDGITGEGWVPLSEGQSPLAVTDAATEIQRVRPMAYQTFDPNSASIVILKAILPEGNPKPLILPPDTVRCTVRVDPLRVYTVHRPEALSTFSHSVLLP
jgi:hypothetical protein